MHCASVVEIHVNVNNTKNIECCTTMLLWRVLVVGNNKKCVGVHVNCSTLLSDFDLDTFPQTSSNTKFRENPNSNFRADTCIQTDRPKWRI